MPLLHTPYDGRAQPFSIGLRPIADDRWISPDALLLPELALKQDLLSKHRDVVVRERADTRAAQAELLGLLVGHLSGAHGEIYSADGDSLRVGNSKHRVALDDAAEPPIVTAAKLIQDDLVLMRKDKDGWRLVAACLCFPSNWSLAEKFDLPMETVHEAVPGYAGQMASRINRIFDHLPEDQIVERFNWSINHDDRLHHPEAKSGPRPWHGLGDRLIEQVFVRVERQTLRRLPDARDIVFTIKVHVDPIAAFRGHPDGKKLALALRTQLADLDRDQLAYKNLMGHRDMLVKALSAFADT